MTFRIEKNGNYTIMCNHHLQNRNLSLKAKGLMSVILSLPDDWDYSLKGLAAISKEGIDSIRAALTELEAEGYIVRTQIRTPGGQWDVEYTIYESPHAEVMQHDTNCHSASQTTALENPTRPDTALDFPIRQTRHGKSNTELNTNNQILNNNIINNNLSNQSESSDEITLVAIHEQIDYNGLTAEPDAKIDVIDGIADIMYEAMNSSKPLYINGFSRPATTVRKQLKKLRAEHIRFIIHSLSTSLPAIKNYRSYMLTTLYNAPSTYWMSDRPATTKASEPDRKTVQKSKNRFHNFEQRDNDYNDVILDISKI
ncbi:MAG: helix-turn-helix domain-containing protein [Lachnospiraceae bacterium]|nr:helix-turn-helix domain-containing protein [Lachnospiraceae bacterium]